MENDVMIVQTVVSNYGAQLSKYVSIPPLISCQPGVRSILELNRKRPLEVKFPPFSIPSLTENYLKSLESPPATSAVTPLKSAGSLTENDLKSLKNPPITSAVAPVKSTGLVTIAARDTMLQPTLNNWFNPLSVMPPINNKAILTESQIRQQRMPQKTPYGLNERNVNTVLVRRDSNVDKSSEQVPTILFNKKKNDIDSLLKTIRSQISSINEQAVVSNNTSASTRITTTSIPRLTTITTETQRIYTPSITSSPKASLYPLKSLLSMATTTTHPTQLSTSFQTTMPRVCAIQSNTSIPARIDYANITIKQEKKDSSASNSPIKPNTSASNSSVKLNASATNSSVKPNTSASNSSLKPNTSASNSSVKLNTSASVIPTVRVSNKLSSTVTSEPILSTSDHLKQPVLMPMYPAHSLSLGSSSTKNMQQTSMDTINTILGANIFTTPAVPKSTINGETTTESTIDGETTTIFDLPTDILQKLQFFNDDARHIRMEQSQVVNLLNERGSGQICGFLMGRVELPKDGKLISIVDNIIEVFNMNVLLVFEHFLAVVCLIFLLILLFHFVFVWWR